MKTILVYLFVSLCFYSASAQQLTVTFVKGKIYKNNNLVKTADQVNPEDKLTSSEKGAELGLFSLQKGRCRLIFPNGKSVRENSKSKSSFLYELLVKNYIANYTTEKALTSRGNFDLFTFFTDSENNDTSKRILIVDGQKLPKRSEKLNTVVSDKFFICTTNKKEVCSAIENSNDSLIFNKNGLSYNVTKNAVTTFDCKIKMGYLIDMRYVEEYFPKSITMTYIDEKYLKDISLIFKKGLDTLYNNNKDLLIKDLEDHLRIYYGDFYSPGIERYLLEYLR